MAGGVGKAGVHIDMVDKGASTIAKKEEEGKKQCGGKG